MVEWLFRGEEREGGWGDGMVWRLERFPFFFFFFLR